MSRFFDLSCLKKFKNRYNEVIEVVVKVCVVDISDNDVDVVVA